MYQVKSNVTLGSPGYDYAYAFTDFYNQTMPIINTAIQNFMAGQNDPVDHAFSVLAANIGGDIGNYSLLISAIPAGTQYDAVQPAQQQEFNNSYPSHRVSILDAVNGYGASRSSVLGPVVWAQRTPNEYGNYIIGSMYWISVAYQQSANQYHAP
jgi:hypothetical protein